MIQAKSGGVMAELSFCLMIGKDLISVARLNYSETKISANQAQ